MFERAERRNDPVVAGLVDAAVDYGYAVPLEPGAIDPVRLREVAAARAARAGMAPVADPASGRLVWVDVGPPDEFATDGSAGWGGDGAAMPDGPWDVPDWNGRPPVEVPPDLMAPPAVGAPVGVPPDAMAPPEPTDPPAVMGSPIVVLPDERWSTPSVPPACEKIAPVETRPVGAGHVDVGGLSPEHVAAAADEPVVRVPARAPGLAELPGGAGLARVLADLDLSAVGAYELVEHIAACERVAAAMHALQAAGVAELAKRAEMRPLVGANAPVQMPAERVTALELGARLVLDDDDAGARVFRSQVLTEVLTDTFVAWSKGWIDTERAWLIADKLGRHDADVAKKVEARVLGGGGGKTIAKLRRQINRALAAELPDREKRHREAKASRFVKITPAADGMAWIEAFVSAEDAAAVEAVLAAGAADLKRQQQQAAAADAAAASAAAGHGTCGTTGPNTGDTSAGTEANFGASADFGAGADFGTGADFSGGEANRNTSDSDDRVGSLSQRRADVLVALAWSALAAGQIGECATCGGEPAGGQQIKLSDTHRRAVTVHVTVPITALLGTSDEPGELAGHGPVTAEVARRLAAHGTWRRILTDPATGKVLDYGRTRYKPPQDLVDHVTARDGTCRWPGCDRPATSPGIQIDHTIAWEDGGPTTEANLGVFCDKNHIDKHHAGWTVSQPTTGEFEFVSPTGHQYTTTPEPVGAIVEPDPPDDHKPPDEADRPGDPRRGDDSPDEDTAATPPDDPDPPPF